MAVKDIVKDVTILKTKSTNAFHREVHHKIERDLIDTAMAHADNCVGLAAIQIGEAVRIFVMRTDGDKFLSFRNPVIIARSNETYIAKEGCLSVDGIHSVHRNEWIKVAYEGGDGRHYTRTFRDFAAEVFQHEYDHLNGIII